MDPISIALASFSAVKAGVAAGKEITSLAKDLGSLFDAIDEVKGDHEKKRSSIFSSANEEALDTFVARKQAEDLENQLREIIIATRGYSAYQELINLRKDIRVQRKKELEDKRKRSEEFWESMLLWGLIFIVTIITCGLGLLALLYYMDRL
jgi:hypothetical protein